MSEHYSVITGGGGESEDADDATGIHISESVPGELAINIFGSDQDATEFLTREQFENLVTNARRIMKWEK